MSADATSSDISWTPVLKSESDDLQSVPLVVREPIANSALPPLGFPSNLTFTLVTLVPEAPGQDDGGLPWLWTGIGAGIGIVALMAFGSFTFVSMRRGPPPDEEQEEELEYNGEPGSWPPPQAIVEPSEVEGAPGPEPSPS